MRITLITALGSLLMGGCSGSESTGRLSIMLTDAPAAADIRAAVVTIDQVYLQSEATGDRIVLREQPFTTDLLTLSSDVATLVESATVPAGSYEQLRFVVSGAYISVA